MDDYRLKHSIAVARKCQEIASLMGLSKDEVKACFLMGYLHDIGYEFAKDKNLHNKVGGEILKNSGFAYWREVYFHGEVDLEYHSVFLNILNQADMQIDKYGNDVGYDRRLEDIKKRYGENSEIYQKCCQLVDKIRG